MQRSHLYDIAPAGGGERRESLTGYFGRLAAEHCVSADRLAQEVVDRCADVGHGILYRHFFVGEARSMDGMGRYARSMASALELLTGRSDLRSLTMLRWAAVLDPRSRTLLRDSRAWCPDCLPEQVSRGEPPHDHLVWRMRAVGWCGVHGRSLVDDCPSCGARQPMISRFGLPGTCHLCGAFLGSPHPKSVHLEDLPKRRWLEQAVRELVRRNDQAGPEPTCSAMLERLRVARARGRLGPGVSDREWKSLRGMHRKWQEGRNRPMLGSLFRFAWATQTRPVWLLDGSGRSSSARSDDSPDDVPDLSGCSGSVVTMETWARR